MLPKQRSSNFRTLAQPPDVVPPEGLDTEPDTVCQSHTTLKPQPVPVQLTLGTRAKRDDWLLRLPRTNLRQLKALETSRFLNCGQSRRQIQDLQENICRFLQRIDRARFYTNSGR